MKFLQIVALGGAAGLVAGLSSRAAESICNYYFGEEEILPIQPPKRKPAKGKKKPAKGKKKPAKGKKKPVHKAKKKPVKKVKEEAKAPQE